MNCSQINLDTPLEENHQVKKHYQIFCSGCTRRGHFVHTCRITLPFSGLPINSPYVAVYRPVYSPICYNDFTQDNHNQGSKEYKKTIPQDSNISSAVTPRNDRLKRQSKSPVHHETHVNKKKNFGTPIDTEQQRAQTPVNNCNVQKKNQQNKQQQAANDVTESNKHTKTTPTEKTELEKAPDFIEIPSENHDKKGQIIQDNEVSDTSDVVTSARIYIPTEIVEKLKTEEGDTWIKEAIKKNNITLESDNITSYLLIKGTVGNQEAFQAELRDWIGTKHNKERPTSESEGDVTQNSVTEQFAMSHNIPKNRNNILRKLTKAFADLKTDLGDPKALYRELMYFQNKHQQLLSQKVVSPEQLANNKSNINGMLKKLNMVLLGQAGLAGGSRHLRALQFLQERLTNYRQKIIPTTLREEVGQHFHYIFTSIPRDDYVDLLNKYYYSRPARPLKKKNKKIFKSPAAVNQKNNQIINNVNLDQRPSKEQARALNALAKCKSKLLFYKQRLMNSKPMDVVLKKAKTELIKELHTHITTVESYKPTDNKRLPFHRDIKKFRQRIQQFLSNV